MTQNTHTCARWRRHDAEVSSWTDINFPAASKGDTTKVAVVVRGAESCCVCHGVGHLWPYASLPAFLWDWQACGFIQPTLGSCKQGNTQTEWYVHAEQWDWMVRPCWTTRLNGTSMLNNETEWYVHAEQWDWMVRPCWTMRLNGTSMLNNETEWYVHAEQWDWMVRPCWITRLNGTSMLNNETEWYVHAEQWDWMVRPCWTTRLNGTSVLNNETEWYVRTEQWDWMVRPCWTMWLNGTSMLLEFTRYVSFHRSMSPPNNSNVSSAWVSRFICACHPATTTVMSHRVDSPADVAFVPASVRKWSFKTIGKKNKKTIALFSAPE